MAGIVAGEAGLGAMFHGLAGTPECLHLAKILFVPLEDQGKVMYDIVETDKSFSQATTDLGSAVTSLGFGVLHVHDLGGTLRSEGIAFTSVIAA